MIGKKVLCAIILLFCTFTNNVISENLELTNIDMLHGRYLEMENILWQMRSYTDKEVLLQRIHNIHLTFLREHFGERNTSIFILDENQESLNDAFYCINTHVTEAVAKLALYGETKFKNFQIIDFARRVISVMQKNMEIINNVTIENDIFLKIARVTI